MPESTMPRDKLDMANVHLTKTPSSDGETLCGRANNNSIYTPRTDRANCEACLTVASSIIWGRMGAPDILEEPAVPAARPEEDQGLVKELIGGRRSVYGDPEQTFQEHADMFTVILNRKLKPGERISPVEVTMLMMGYKLVRAIQAPGYSDNIDDVVGYADIFKAVQGDDFIQARTVDEYLEKKSQKRAAQIWDDAEPESKLYQDNQGVQPLKEEASTPEVKQESILLFTGEALAKIAATIRDNELMSFQDLKDKLKGEN